MEIKTFFHQKGWPVAVYMVQILALDYCERPPEAICLMSEVGRFIGQHLCDKSDGQTFDYVIHDIDFNFDAGVANIYYRNNIGPRADSLPA